MARILLSAEAYGYGPVAKADAIARSLQSRGHNVHFVGTGTALRFSEESKDLYGHIGTELGKTTRADDLDAVVSVMDPWPIIWARHRGFPAVYVDSLFWMWNWADDAHVELDALVERFLAIPDESQARDLLETVPMHDAQYVAHRLSTLSIVQRYTTRDDSLLRRRMSTLEVGAIVDRRQVVGQRKDIVLASVSGSVNPFTPVERARQWAGAVVQMLGEARAKAGSTMDIWVCGNPDVLRHLEEPRTGGVLLRPQQDHGDYLRLLSRATCLIAPPGITSMAEAWAYGVPFVSLPQQHYAHSTIWNRVRSIDPSAFPDFQVPMPLGKHQSIEAATSAIIDDVIDQLSPAHRSGAVEELAGILDDLEGGEGVRIASAQAHAFASIFHTPEGASEVCDVIDRVCGVR